MFLAIFEFLGTSELLVILVVALIIFGPRRLPQLSRQLGKSLSEFKRASEDFKRTWEKEVEMEKFEEEGRMMRSMLQDEDASIKNNQEKSLALDEATATDAPLTVTEPLAPTIARSTSTATREAVEPDATATDTPFAPETSGKRDWL